MEALVISDIQWELPNENIFGVLKTEIDTIAPSLVLFAGDVINDGMNSEEHVAEFTDLLEHLEELEITSFTIPGNHDEYSNYEAVEARIDDLAYAQEISGEVVEFNGVSVLGIPYSYTHRLGRARQLRDEFSGQYDLVVAHAESRRRIWLFNLDTRFIITGHFAERLFQVRDRVFVSMGASPSDMVLVNLKSDEVLYRRRTDSYQATQDRYEAEIELVEGELRWLRDEYEPDFVGSRPLQDFEYPERLERLMWAKEAVEDVSEDEEREIIEELLEAGIPKTHIREYIQRYDFL